MIRNYLKIAIGALKRNPFFTGVSLFGIGFTLMLLMLVASLYESNLGSLKPFTNKNKMVLSGRAMLQLYVHDTLTTYDTVQVEGQMVIDSSEQISSERTSGWYDNTGYYLLDKHFRDIDFVDKYTFFNDRNNYDVFVNDQKIPIKVNHTDANYWQVFDFDFVEGAPYSANDVESISQVAVITSKLSTSLFGKNEGVLGQKFKTNGKDYIVVGVIEDVSTFTTVVNSDAYFPLTQLSPNDLSSKNLIGPFSSAFLGKRSQDVPTIIANINDVVDNIQIPADINFNKLLIPAGTLEQTVGAQILPVDDDPKVAWRILKGIIFGLVLLFIAVPTINLINLNITRILERSGEIGIRKAFGATTGNIVNQLIFENIVLTLIGGILGVLGTFAVIYLINNSSLDLFKLQFNAKVFMYGLVMTLIFGLISGLLPALKTSKMHIIEALKNSKL